MEVWGRKICFVEKVIVAKYGVDKWGWVPKICSRLWVSSVWGVISEFGNVLSSKGEILSEGVGYKVAEGEKCLFFA